MTVTVCIPAYRAGRFFAETLKSVANQTYPDLRVEIGVDPADADGTGSPEDTLAALKPFLGDPRFQMRSNPARLGWDGNIRALLERVETPYYAILPHDDIWHPRYIEILLGTLVEHPTASVAYCDLISFGTPDPWRHAVELPDTTDLREQLLSFMIQGAEAMPWRGVTRTAVLQSVGGFPTDGHRGFAVECEYALALLLAGTAVHVPRTLYFKRIHAPEVISASRARQLEPNRVELEQAWRNHIDRMERRLRDGLSCLPREPADSMAREELIWPAFQAAMLRHCPPQVRLSTADVDKVHKLMAGLAAVSAPEGNLILSRLHLVLWRHANSLGDVELAGSHAEAAVSANPKSPYACFAMASYYETRGRLLEALELVTQSEPGFRGWAGPIALRRKIYKRLGWSPPPA